MLKIYWKKHELYNDHILGIVKELPDTHCHFLIMRHGKGKFCVHLPSRGAENLLSILVFRCPVIAREFCEDFLNSNLRVIIKYQIRELERTSRPGLKPISYYQDMLQKLGESPIPNKRKWG